MTREMFTELHRSVPKGDVEVIGNVSYGPDPLQEFDIYRAESIESAPIVVFMHGGAYVRGARNSSDEISSNIPRFFARNGLIGINIDYRLAPAAPWPAGPEDLGTVVRWLKKNGEQYGGDANRIFLIGSSAGATHVATYAYHPALRGDADHGVAGIILVSGRYRIAPKPSDPNYPNVQAYFGSDPKLYPERSVITHVQGGPSIPTYIVIAEYDNEGLDVSGAELFAALCARDGACPRFSRLERHNHVSPLFAIGTTDQYLARQILDFIELSR